MTKVMLYTFIGIGILAAGTIPGPLREWLDILHHYVGPTALFITALAFISMQEYCRFAPDKSDTVMLKQACRTAELCPTVGTIGTFVSIAQADVMNAELIGHAINSTLYGLGYWVGFSFFTRGQIAGFIDMPIPDTSTGKAFGDNQQQPQGHISATENWQPQSSSHPERPSDQQAESPDWQAQRNPKTDSGSFTH